MKPFVDAREPRWSWVRPGLWSRRYELHSGDDVVAVLESRSVLRSAMVATTASGHWELRHIGLLRGKVLVTAFGATAPAATFHPHWFGAGDVTTQAGQSLRWRRADFWGRRWQFVDSGGLERITFERAPGFLRADTHVLLSEPARADSETEPLVLLGQYLLLLMARQSHAAT